MTSSSSFSSSRRFFGEEWTPLSTRIPGGGRKDFAYASLGDDRHYVFGGWAHSRSSVVVKYDSTSQTFHTHPPLPETRARSAATAIDDRRLLVVGGRTSYNEKSCLVYDTRRKEWSTHWPHLNIARYHHACVCTTNNKVYVVGGHNLRALDSVEELDLSRRTPSWKILPQRLNKGREGCCAIAHPKMSNKIIVVGGHNRAGDLSCCELVSLEEGQEGQTRTLPSMMTPRAYHALVLVENRFVVAMGGRPMLSSVEYLDLEEEPQEQQWLPLPAMRTGRIHFAAFYSPRNHKIVVAGGFGYENRLDVAGGRGLNDRLDIAPPLRLYNRPPIAGERGLYNSLDTVEELPVLFVRPPPLRDFPSGLMDPSHWTKILQWLDETKQLTGFVKNINKRERELIHECQEIRQICNDYIAHVDEKQSQARGILAGMQDTTGTRENPTNTPAAVQNDRAVIALHQDLRRPPSLTDLPTGQMDAAHRRKIELWMEESDRKKNAYVAAVDTQEIKQRRDVHENRRKVRSLQNGARDIMACIDNPSTGGNTQHGPSDIRSPPNELLCPITYEVMVDPVMTADGHTYERSAIERVFQHTGQGQNPRSPVTGLLLPSRLLIPNVAVRSMCMDCREEEL